MIALETALARLAANAETIGALARGIPDEQARWKPTPEAWSILEVLAHLHDEEREDFRTRLRLTLEQPAADWPPIDPAGWVRARDYNQREPRTTLDAFLHERLRSLEWLRSLPTPDWTSAHRHPGVGTMTAAEMLGAWVVHDHLHIRQLNELHWLYVSQSLTTLSLDYAGGGEAAKEGPVSAKDELLNQAAREYNAFEAAIHGLNEAQLTQVCLGTWSIREIVAHISGWHREMGPALERLARGERPLPDGVSYDDVDAWNARFVEAARAWPLDEVLLELDRSHEYFMRMAAKVPEERVQPGRTAYRIIDLNGAHHYHEHGDQIRAWRAAQDL